MPGTSSDDRAFLARYRFDQKRFPRDANQAGAANLALMRGFSHTRRGKSMKRKTITSRVVAELANICMAITGMPAALRGEVFVPMCPGLIAVLESRNRRHQNQEPKRNDFLHLTTATVDTRDQNKGRQTVLSTFCLIALLLATLVQCLHTCAVPRNVAGASHRFTSRVPNGPCTACLLGQAIAISALLMLASSLLARPATRVQSRSAPVEAWHGFIVSVRPPPLA